MFKRILQSIVVLMVTFSSIQGDQTRDKDIIEVLDYKLQRIQSNLNNELLKIKEDLAQVKNSTKSQEPNEKIMELDQSIDSLQGKLLQVINESKKREELFEGKLSHYESLIPKEHKPNYNWFFVFGVLFLIITFIIVKIYIEHMKKHLQKETAKMLQETMKKYQEQLQNNEKHTQSIQEEVSPVIYTIEDKIAQSITDPKVKKHLTKHLDTIKKQYQDKELSEAIIYDELKLWVHSFEKKKIKKELKEFIETLQAD